MIDKEALVIDLLKQHLPEIKVGVIIKGIDDINPKHIVMVLTEKSKDHLYCAAVGYSGVMPAEETSYTLSTSIEKAVLWRSVPDYAGKIVVFVSSDSDKLHSLAEFDIISIRDLSQHLIAEQIKSESNTPTHNFWAALAENADYFSFEAICDFVSSVQSAQDQSAAIPVNMWRLNLLSDSAILSTKNKPADRLRQNRELIIAIGQLSEDSRKKLSRSLSRTKGDDKERLQKAYRILQNFYKYAKKTTLKELSFDTVKELFSASQKKDTPPKPPQPENPDDPIEPVEPEPTAPIRPKELDGLISDAIVSGDADDMGYVKELLDALAKHYDSEENESKEELPTIGGPFGDRTILLENNQTSLRKLVGRVCNTVSWGALIETSETVLKDAISADTDSLSGFNPVDPDSLVSFKGGIDGSHALFDFLIQFDAQFKEKHIQTAELFAPIIENLIEKRSKLCEQMDLIMYHPVLLFGSSDDARNNLIDYIRAWEQLYHAFSVNEPTMRQISTGGTSFVARALLLLDVLYIQTPKEWKAILLPLHPIYLWRYYEVFRTLPNKRASMSDDDKIALTKVLSKLPQVLSFVIANTVVTGSTDDKVLPCSGNIEMLPTFENKTNRYLGDDGTASVGEILSRWIGFAPYTKEEVRICSVDAPDLTGIIRQVKDFMDKSGCNRVVFDVYLTRNQNGNTELSKLDYSGKDYAIGEYLRSGKINISIMNVASAREVKTALNTKPVHVAFYFDQSAYAIEFGPNSQNLYINPLVITYDYDFDEIQHKGIIFPSSEMDSGLIGDYHKLMKSADVISNNMNPRTTYNGNADMSDVVSTIHDRQVQWLIAADRDTNNYQPQSAIPIGEVQYDKRMVNAWASSDSRIFSQYITLLRGYNLYPKQETLIDLLKEFGHIASNGLISIPKYGADSQAIENKKKGLIGTLFAASWYTKKYKDALVASLDDDKARLWLQNNRYGNERADLVGLYYDEEKNTLHIQPIEVKTRDESPDTQIAKDEVGSGFTITGHAADQVSLIVEMLKEIFSADENVADMFTAARREVLKYQIVSECFRNVHDANWQKKWHGLFKKAFASSKNKSINIEVSGIILHIKLNEATGGLHYLCHNPEFDDSIIEFYRLTSQEIQQQVLGIDEPTTIEPVIDFDETKSNGNRDEDETLTHAGDVIEPLPVPTPVPAEAPKMSEIGKQEDAAESLSDKPSEQKTSVSMEEIDALVKDFVRSCNDYHVNLKECVSGKAVVGPSVIRLAFKLARGQALQGLLSHLEDIGREMKRTGVIVQQVPNSDELLLDVPRLQRERVLFKDVVSKLPPITSPEQLYFPLGRTPNGKDLIEDLGQMPHMLVGGSTGSGKSVFLFTMLASMLMSHPNPKDLQLVLSSSKLEDFIHFEGLPHLYNGGIISDATEATEVIKNVIFEESERRGKLLADARVANIVEYNKKASEKLSPIVVVIDEFADLSDQLESKKDKEAFFKPVQRIAQAGRSRGIHLVICTQRPEAKLVPPTTKAQLNGRVALRVNDGISSRMIIDAPDAQYLQKHGDMIFRNSDIVERAQGYLIEIPELDEIVQSVIKQNQ